MHVYETYCRETFDEKGRLTQIQLDYPADFNFAYDVVDAMARLAPQQSAGLVQQRGPRGAVHLCGHQPPEQPGRPGFSPGGHPPGRPGDGGAEAPL